MALPLSENSWSEQLRTLIRYLASGFVTIMVLRALGLYQDLVPHTGDSVWYSVIVAAVFGLIIYAAHAAIADNFFYRTALRVVIRKTNRDDYLPPMFKEFIDDRETKYNIIKKFFYPIAEKNIKLFKLKEFRFCREGTNHPKLASIQKRLDQNLTLMAFLYASSYPLFFLPVLQGLYFLISHLLGRTHDIIAFDPEHFLIFLSGIVLMIIGLTLDINITTWEMWFIKKYQLDENCDEVLFSEKNSYFIEIKFEEGKI